MPPLNQLILPDEALIVANTAPVRPTVLPELQLRLVTIEQAWWTADPDNLSKQGIVDPYWAFCWPGGTALARLVLDYPALVRGRRVLDIGSGCGVAAIAARRAGASCVVANDIDPWALKSAAINAELNDVSLAYDSRDLIGASLDACDTLLLGDVTYAKDLVANLLPWFAALHARHVRILIADPQRGFLPQDWQPTWQVKVPAEIDADLSHWVQVPIYEYGVWDQEG